MNLSVWMSVLASLVTMPLLLYAFAKMEERATGKRLIWSSLTMSGWYVFSTLIGENITAETSFKNAYAMRCYSIFWGEQSTIKCSLVCFHSLKELCALCG